MTKKAANVPAVSLTADGVNGMSSKADESLDVAAEDEASTSMQAEAAQTTEKELHDEYESEEEIDQAAALLEGFDSDTEDLAQDAGFDKSKPTGALPNYKKTQKKLKQAAQKGNKDGPGTVYVGRIPHGFYETEMRQYFSQFGTISKLRLSRNRKSGRSKHFAFLEFESNEVAKIVSETMDNYLLFGHILKCKYVEPESLHPDTFKGANKRFRVAPHNRMEKRALEAPKSESQWKKKNSKEQSRREKKAEKLKAMGYEIELPKLRSPTEVLQERESRTAGNEEGPKESQTDGKDVPVPTTVPDDEDALSRKKSKKGKKEKTNAAETKVATLPTTTTNADASNHVPPQNSAEKDSEKRDERKGKREKSKTETKQLAALMAADETPPAAKGQPAKTGVEATTASSDSAKASQSPKPKKKKKGKGENAQFAEDETPAPAIATPETASAEKEASPPIAPAENVEECKTKKKSKKRKSSGAE
jgi:nucleolar protein 15